LQVLRARRRRTDAERTLLRRRVRVCAARAARRWPRAPWLLVVWPAEATACRELLAEPRDLVLRVEQPRLQLRRPRLGRQAPAPLALHRTLQLHGVPHTRGLASRRRLEPLYVGPVPAPVARKPAPLHRQLRGEPELCMQLLMYHQGRRCSTALVPAQAVPKGEHLPYWDQTPYTRFLFDFW